MTDIDKVQKLLNLTSSINDAEALSALRMAQKFLELNLGDYLATAGHGLSPASSSKDRLYEELEQLFEAEVEKVRTLKQQRDDKDKDLRKRERDNVRLKRDNKALEQKIEDYEKALNAKAQSASAKPEANEYEELEMLFEAEVDKSAHLKSLLDDKDKAVKKTMRDISRLKRDADTYEEKIEGLEKMVNDLSLELMALKQSLR